MRKIFMGHAREFRFYLRKDDKLLKWLIRTGI